MADDMIERVAKRLWDHSFDRMPDPPWEQTSELQKRFNRMLAREAIAEMSEPTEKILAALKDVFALMDEGWLVRNTSEDHKPSFAMRQLSFVQRLAKAHAAIANAESAAPKQPGAT